MGGRPKRSHWECDDSVVLSLVLESLPTEKKLIHFHAIRRVLNYQVESLYQHAHIRAYGSVASNLPMPHSDVDLCIVFDDVEENECPKQWRVQVLKTMRTIVRRMTETVRGNSMEARFHARVPVLCFQHKPSGLDVDINTMDQGIFKAGFMRQMTNLSPLLVPLVRIVKLWAYRSDLNDPTDGTLNSYCLTLLAIFHLQQLIVPQLPPIWKLLPASPPQRKRRPSAAQTSGSGESSDAGTSQVSISNGTSVQQRPQSSHRIMNAMKRPPIDALDEIQRRVSQWRKECAPPAQQLPLDSIVLAFYVRFSAFLLARYRRFNDTCWRTVSTWAASLFPCKKQKMKLKEDTKGKGSRGNVHKCMGKNNMADEADPVVLLRELLRTLRRHWTKSGGDIRTYNAAVARVLEASALMIPPGGVSTLRKEFPAIVEETAFGASADSEPITSGAASTGWVDGTTQRQAQMLDCVYKFLLQVPQSSRGNEKAAVNKQRANDLLDSSDGSSAPEAEMSSSEDSDTQGRGYLTAEAANALPGDSATEPAGQGAQGKPSAVQQHIVRDKALEAKENDLILDMSSDDDESMHESGASAAAQPSTSRQVPQTRLSSNTPSGATVFMSAVAGKDTAPDADAGIGPEIVSAPVFGALCSSKDLPPVSALSQALADHGGGSGDNARQVPPDRAACGGTEGGFVTGACTHPGFQVPADSAASTQGFQGIRGAPSASVPGQQHDTAIAQELYMGMAAELHSNSQSWPEDSPAERVRAVCRQRLAALDCELAVEDPFDECDNAARTLRHFGQLLAHTLLPVLYGTDALECLLRQPPPKPNASGAQQHLQDTVRQAYNTMQRFEHPIQTDSDENRKINWQATQWTAQAVGGRDKDREGSFFRQLSDSHMQALGHCQKSTKQYQGPHIASGHGPSVMSSTTKGARAHHDFRGVPQNGGNRGQPQGAVHINPNEFPTLACAPGSQAPHPGPQHGNAPGPRPCTQQAYQPPHANRHSHNAPAQRPIHGPIQHQQAPQMRDPPGAVHHHTHPNPHAPTQVIQHPQGGHGVPPPPSGRPHARPVPIADLFHSSAQQARPPPAPHAREPLSQAQYAPSTSAAHLVTSASVDKDAAQKGALAALGNTHADHNRHGGVRGHGAGEANRYRNR